MSAGPRPITGASLSPSTPLSFTLPPTGVAADAAAASGSGSTSTPVSAYASYLHSPTPLTLPAAGEGAAAYASHDADDAAAAASGSETPPRPAHHTVVQLHPPRLVVSAHGTAGSVPTLYVASSQPTGKGAGHSSSESAGYVSDSAALAAAHTHRSDDDASDVLDRAGTPPVPAYHSPSAQPLATASAAAGAAAGHSMHTSAAPVYPMGMSSDAAVYAYGASAYPVLPHAHAYGLTRARAADDGFGGDSKYVGPRPLHAAAGRYAPAPFRYDPFRSVNEIHHLILRLQSTHSRFIDGLEYSVPRETAPHAEQHTATAAAAPAVARLSESSAHISAYEEDLAEIEHQITLLADPSSHNLMQRSETIQSLFKKALQTLQETVPTLKAQLATTPQLIEKWKQFCAFEANFQAIRMKHDDPTQIDQYLALQATVARTFSPKDPLLDVRILGRITQLLSHIEQSLYGTRLCGDLFELIVDLQIAPTTASVAELERLFNYFPSIIQQKIMQKFQKVAGKAEGTVVDKAVMFANLPILEQTIFALGFQKPDLGKFEQLLQDHERVAPAITTALIGKFLSSWLPEDVSGKIYGSVWKLAGEPKGDPNWGKNNAHKDLSRLQKAVALHLYPPTGVPPYAAVAAAAAAPVDEFGRDSKIDPDSPPLSPAPAAAGSVSIYTLGGPGAAAALKGSSQTAAAGHDSVTTGPAAVATAAPAKAAFDPNDPAKQAILKKGNPAKQAILKKGNSLFAALGKLIEFQANVLPALTDSDPKNDQVIWILEGNQDWQVAGNEALAKVERSVPQDVCDDLYGKLYKKAGSPQTTDPTWARNNLANQIANLMAVINEELTELRKQLDA